MKNHNIKRNKQGKFTRTKKFATITFSLFMVASVLYITYYSQVQAQAQSKVEYVDKVTVVDTTQEIINNEKADILNVLQNCESTDNKDVIVWEDYGVGKNRPSFGAYQLKVGTVQLYLKGLTDFQAIALAGDINEARKFSEDVIFNHNGISNWKRCMVKHNLLARVNFVKELEAKSNTN